MTDDNAKRSRPQAAIAESSRSRAHQGDEPATAVSESTACDDPTAGPIAGPTADPSAAATQRVDSVDDSEAGRSITVWSSFLSDSPAQALDRLVIVEGPVELSGRVFELNEDHAPIIAGRSARCAIHLNGPRISSEHARFDYSPRGWCIHDLGSRSHVYIGSLRVGSHTLLHGEEIVLGDARLLFLERGRGTEELVEFQSGIRRAAAFRAELALMDHTHAEHYGIAVAAIRLEGLLELLSNAPGRGVDDIWKTIRNAAKHAAPEGTWARSDIPDVLFLAERHADSAEVKAKLDAFARELNRGRRLAVEVTRVHAVRVARGEEPAISLLDAVQRDLPRLRRGAEVDTDVNGAPVLDNLALLAELRKRKPRAIALLSIEEEDYVRHVGGDQDMDQLRWSVRRYLRRYGTSSVLCGILDGRVGLVAGEESAVAGVAAQVQREFLGRSLTGKSAAVSLKVTRPNPAGLPIDGDPRDLEDSLIERAERSGTVESEFARPHFLDLLPSPLAASYHLIHTVSTYAGRYGTVFGAFETTARFVGLTALAAAAATIAPQRAEYRGLLSQFTHRKLTIGAWLEIVRLLRGVLASAPSEAVQLVAEAIGRSSKDNSFDQIAGTLLPLRNHIHRMPRIDEAEAKARLPELLEHLHALYEHLKPLCGLTLLTCTDILAPLDSGLWRVDGQVHVGARELFEVRRFTRKSHLVQGETYLMTLNAADALRVSPGIRLAVCPQCNRSELWLLSGLLVPGKPMEAYGSTTGHETSWTFPDQPSDDDPFSIPSGVRNLVGVDRR